MKSIFLACRCLFLLFCLFAVGICVSGCYATIKDVEMHGGDPSLQKILTAAEEIGALTKKPQESKKDAEQQAAKTLFDNALATWKTSPASSTWTHDIFRTVPAKLFDAYIGYLIEQYKVSQAIEVLRSASQEADSARSYRVAISYRLKLADTLARVGQLEAAQITLTEAQELVDRIFGKLAANNVDPFQLAANAAVLSATIRLGMAVDTQKLASFVNIYAGAIEQKPALRYVSIDTPAVSFTTTNHLMNDNGYYRRDHEIWRWLAVESIRTGDRQRARSYLANMLQSAEMAAVNQYLEKYANKRDASGFVLPSVTKTYMQTYYTGFENLRHQKFADAFFGYETKFDSSIAAAEMYLMLDDLALSEKMLAQARETLPIITAFSDELKTLGHRGLQAEQRKAELQRVTGKLLLKNQRWQEALAQFDQYIAWSEAHRNNLSLEERLPYFRSQAQSVYMDAVLAKASLYVAQPTEANFLHALEALGKLKARHLRDSLDAGGKIKTVKENSAQNSLALIVKENQGFLSVADAGDKVIVFYADSDGKKIRITNKPKDFDKEILTFRNNLAERQTFDPLMARRISTQTLGELESKVFGKKKLVAEIDGSLSFLPIELWLDSKMTPLGKVTAVAYIPSLAMTDLVRTSNPVKGLLALGDARFDQNLQVSAIGGSNEYATRGKKRNLGFTPLPETRDEVVSIIKSVREGGKAILGQDATKSSFFQEAKQPYRYLHFATHGVVGGEIPRLNEPALVLTPESNDPGFLTASEISKMDIAADLVVLSACNTGNGEYYNGEGLMGLGRAFILAGAKAVVVSLWPVDSLTTKELMVKFYRELETTGSATLALANARTAIMESRISKNPKELRKIKGKASVAQVAAAQNFSGHKNPFYWAPFVVVESGL